MEQLYPRWVCIVCGYTTDMRPQEGQRHVKPPTVVTLPANRICDSQDFEETWVSASQLFDNMSDRDIF